LLILTKYIQTYAYLYVVLADLRPWLAIENAYAVFKNNAIASIIISLLSIFTGIIASFIVIVIALITFFISSLIGIVFFILLLIVFLSFFSAFIEVAWVLFFHVIATPKEKVKVIEEITGEENETSGLPSTETIKTIEVETKE
jgi:hypothetical protein